MKAKTLCAVLISGSLFWAGVAAADLKVGYVDAKKVLEQAPQAQAMMDKLEKEFKPRKDEVVATQDKLKRVQDKLNRDGDVMSDAERTRAQSEEVALRRELQRHQEDFQDDLNLRRNQELSKLQVLVNEAINAIGGDGKYDLILYDGIAFANPRLDLTNEVLDWLSKHNTSPAAKKSH